MKNKGRRQLAGLGSFRGIADCKSLSIILTRPITQMGSRHCSESETHGLGTRGKSKKFFKKKWSKRVRGYFKSQTKDI